MKLGIEVLLESPKLIRELKKRRVALVCHPSSVDQKLRHSFDLLNSRLKLAAAFGPQHGIKGEKQDNMIESDDYIHPKVGIPIYSLYGKVRRPTPQMMKSFDVVIFDLQDLGCRIYTFITTLLYMMEECSKLNKEMIILDRPNPIGRGVEGFTLEKGYESFVGAAEIPMRHGLTVGELALFFKSHFKLNLDLKIIKMKGYKPSKEPWPSHLVWVNPSPNAANLNMARNYPGSVLLEGTNLSEGRGTTRPLEVIGAAGIDFSKVLEAAKTMAPSVFKNTIIREIYFEPMFHKFKGELCHGLHIHAEGPKFKDSQFKPYRMMAVILKCVRQLYPEFILFRDFPYEYVTDKLAFDVINGGPKLKNWIEQTDFSYRSLDSILLKDEKAWKSIYKKYWLY